MSDSIEKIALDVESWGSNNEDVPADVARSIVKRLRAIDLITYAGFCPCCGEIESENPTKEPTPAQAGTVGNGERWLRSLIGTLDADADTLMLLAAQRITGGAQAGAELPEPAWETRDDDTKQVTAWYTADQMRAYAELTRRGGSDAK